MLLRIVDLLREVIPAAVRGRSDPIPQYSLEQLSRICEEMALVGKTDTLSGTQGGASIFRPHPSTMKHVVEIADAIRSA